MTPRTRPRTRIGAGDINARARAIDDLWNAVGYWFQPRTPYSDLGNLRVPPRMFRMPRGRAVCAEDHAGQWRAVTAWAAWENPWEEPRQITEAEEDDDYGYSGL